jgi:MoaA/NifB/PqqE/SkfB family radical SAM enzyme
MQEKFVLSKGKRRVSRGMLKDLLQITFSATNKCNSFGCKHCDIWKQKPPENEFTKEEYQKVIDNLADFKGFLICLCGGEPFIRSDLHELYKITHDALPEVTLSSVTNGIATEKTVSDCKHILSFMEPSQIQMCISLDGNAREHDYLRGDGTFKRMIETNRKLRKLGMNTHANVTITQKNVNCLEEIKEIADREFSGIYWGVYGTGGQFFGENKNDELSLTIKGRKKAISFLKKYDDDWIVYSLIKYLQGKEVPCQAGRLSLIISSTLDVFPCSNCPQESKLGNLRDSSYDLDRVLSSTRAQKILNECSKCSKCFNLLISHHSYAKSNRYKLDWALRKKGARYTVDRGLRRMRKNEFIF